MQPPRRLPLNRARVEEAQAYLDRWEVHWADTRIHGTTKRQVAAMFAEEKPALVPLPLEPFRFYRFGERTVNLDGAADASAQREAIELLRSGRALVMFPEGGRTKTGHLMPFKMGAFRLALTHGVPIVPVSIKGAERIWPVGQFMFRPGKLTVTYHPPIKVDRIEDASRTELKERARQLARVTHDVVAGPLDQLSLPEAGDEPVSA